VLFAIVLLREPEMKSAPLALELEIVPPVKLFPIQLLWITKPPTPVDDATKSETELLSEFASK
jgi:hypothetical protein